MIGSEKSPPAFSWDHWYDSIGGRTISIKEVDSILNEIREYQYPKFKGEVSRKKILFETSSAASAEIKEAAFALGADEVGIAEIEPSDIYKGRVVNEKFAIVVGQRMLWRSFQEVPSHDSAVEC